MLAAPIPNSINAETLYRITGQTAIVDVATASGIERDARSAAELATTEFQSSSKAVKYRRLRNFPAKLNLPGWVVGLISASVATLAFCLPMIFVFNARERFLLLVIFGCYAIIGGGVFWFLLDEQVETDSNRAEIRATRLREAIAMRNVAAESRSRINKELENASWLVAAFHRISEDELTRLLAIDPGRLYPDEFEQFLVDILRFLGYTAAPTGKTGDQGMDVIAERNGVRLAIQAKKYSSAVGNDAVQQVFAGMHHHRCQRCAVITTAGFTASARALAISTGCLLIDGSQIPDLIRGEIQL